LPARVQAPCADKPFHTWDLSDGTQWARFYRTPTGFMLRFPALADFEVSTDGLRVTCQPTPNLSEATAEHLFLNQVRPLALSAFGKLVFHASVVEAGGGAVAFLAASGRGKSTLAAGFAVNGRRFLADDGLVVKHDNGHYVALPGHPSLRLWSDGEERLLGGGVRTAAALDYTSKARLLAGPRLPHCNRSRPLLAAYFLADGSVEDITIKRFAGAEALIAWVKHSFLLDVHDKTLIAGHFHQIAALANTVPSNHLAYPRRYDELSRVCDSVLSHANKLRL
jgi:hypothetical protein